MKSKCIAVGPLGTNCYIIQSEDQTLVIDPGADFQEINEALFSEPNFIVFTHTHWDHTGALEDLIACYPNAKIALGGHEPLGKIPKADILLSNGDLIGPFIVLHTPGHTMGSICLYNAEEKMLFSGDTLFYQGWGRTDLGGNDKAMEESLKKLFTLEEDTQVFPGHGERTTIGKEKRWNRFF